MTPQDCVCSWWCLLNLVRVYHALPVFLYFNVYVFPYFVVSVFSCFNVSVFTYFNVFVFFGIYFWPVWSPPTSTYVANLYYVSHGVSHCCRTRNTHSITSHLDQNPEGPLSHSFRNAGLFEHGFSPQVTARHTLMKYYSNSFLQREKLENRYKFWIPLCITLEVRGIFVLWIDWVKSWVCWEWALMRKLPTFPTSCLATKYNFCTRSSPSLGNHVRSRQCPVQSPQNRPKCLIHCDAVEN